MAAAPKSGVMIWQGASGKRYNVTVYFSDVVGADINWSQDGAPGTSSPNFWVAPENVALVDFAIPTGLTDTTGVKFKTNDTPTGQQLLHALFINTLATRPVPGFGAQGGKKITFTQF